MKVEEAIQEYQCPGCTNGPYPECFKDDKTGGLQCESHCCGTIVSNGIGSIFLGMPKGFDRKGACQHTKIWIFESFDKSTWPYDKFNVPIWKHLDKHGNTLVRGICPRLNDPWIHIFLEDCKNKIECIEITTEDISEMD